MSFISPKLAIQEGWITGIVDESKQIQPNAIDFTLDVMFHITAHSTFVISEEGKQMRTNRKMEPIVPRTDSDLGWWTLDERQVYDCMSDIYVKLPEQVAALLIIRSTFNRNGLFITSGLYDSGYEGHIGFALHNQLGTAKIAQGTRVGQIMFVQSESAGLYAGGWNHAEGTVAKQLAPQDLDCDGSEHRDGIFASARRMAAKELEGFDRATQILKDKETED